jgi:hypothetical protein
MAASTKLVRCSMSCCCEPLEGVIASMCAFDYFSGYDPTSSMFIASGRKKHTRAV